MSQAISKFNLLNKGAFVAELHVIVNPANGDKEYTYKDTKDICVNNTNSLDLKEIKGLKDGDSVRLLAFVRFGKDHKASEKFIYQEDSNYVASYTVSGTTLNNKLHLDSVKEYFTASDYNPSVSTCEIGNFKLSNNGSFVARIKIIGMHPTGKTFGYSQDKDITIGKSKSVSLSDIKDFEDGDIVYLKAIVVAGIDRNAPERFIYRKNCKNTAHYAISGTTLSSTLTLKNLDEFYNDPDVIRKQTYTKVGTSPKDIHTDFSNDVQGICHDDSFWYISNGAGLKDHDRNYGSIHRISLHQLDSSTGCSEKKQADCYVYSHGKKVPHRFYKYYKNNFLVGSKIGEIHYGDIDCYNGYIFVPAYQNGNDGDVDAQILVFSTETFDCVWSEVLYKKGSTSFSHLSWCAVNPNDGCLYTSDSHLSENFENGASPLMAFKINFENLKKGQGPVFTNVTPNGIPLKTQDGKAFGIAAGMQGGCFDLFDTLYLNSGFYENHVMNEGVYAFKMQRDYSAKTDEYIRTRAYYIWKEKGCPLQSDKERENDWIKARWQIVNANYSGFLKYETIPYAAEVLLKKNSKGKLVSTIDYSFEVQGDSLSAVLKPQEPEGLTFWDIRKYYKDNNPTYCRSMLHVLKLINNGRVAYNDTISVENFNITNLETFDKVIDYDPSSLKIDFNPISQRWVVLSKNSIPVKDFCTEKEANDAMKIISQYSQLRIIGNTTSDKKEYDFRMSLLRQPEDNFKSPSIDTETYNYNEIRVTGWNQGDTEKQVSESKNFDSYQKFHLWEALFQTNADAMKAGNPYQVITIFAHNETDAWKIANSGRGYNKLRYIKASSEKTRDNLYWFEK